MLLVYSLNFLEFSRLYNNYYYNSESWVNAYSKSPQQFESLSLQLKFTIYMYIHIYIYIHFEFEWSSLIKLLKPNNLNGSFKLIDSFSVLLLSN